VFQHGDAQRQKIVKASKLKVFGSKKAEVYNNDRQNQLKSPIAMPDYRGS
jgi:hypothetical protein